MSDMRNLPSDKSLAECLDKEVQLYRGSTFASSTNRTYMTQKTAYFEFCAKVKVSPLPISQTDLGRYIAFLSRRLCFSSVRQYLNVVRLLHLEAGFTNPLENNWYVKSILQGVKRVKGNTVKQKLPITLDILRGIFTRLNLAESLDRCFWSACLVAFFSFFRKSNLLVQSPSDFNPALHLCATDAQFNPKGVVLTVRWSKVIQFRERILLIPLPHIPKSPFCPSTALLTLLLDCPATSTPAPLFRYRADGNIIILTQDNFTKKLHDCLRGLGFEARDFSGHSFRRGGASFGLQCGLSPDLIKLQGDWNSNSYERYLQPSFHLRQDVACRLGRAAEDLTRCEIFKVL